MSDKSFGIIVTGDVSDIESKLSSLVDSLNGLVDRIINVDVNVNVTELNELNTEIEQLENETITTDVIVNDTQLTDVSTEMVSLDNQSIDWAVNVDDTQLTDISTEIASLDNQSIDWAVNVDDTSLSTLSSDAAQAASDIGAISDAAADASNALSTIDAATLVEAASAAGALGDSLGAASEEASSYSSNMEGASDSTSALSGAASALVSLGIGAFFAEAVNGAGNFNDSWGRLANAVGEGGTAIGVVQAEWTTAITTMTENTGRSAGVIREYIINMGTAGVTSKDILISSFSGIAGAAYVTGNSIETIENAFKRVVSTGTLGSRQLVQLGLTSQDVYNATGMSVEDVSAKLQTMDTNQRAAFLGHIMNAKYGSEANEAYKNSWEHVLDVLQRTWAFLSRLIGDLILPVLIPALEFVSWILSSLAGYIQKLDGPMRTVVSAVTILAGGFVFLATTMGALKGIMDLLQIRWVLETLGILSNTAATDANTASQNLGLLSRIRLAAASAGNTAATIANTVATTVSTAAQWLWNAAQDAGIISALRAVASLAVMVVSMGAYALAAGLATAAQWALNIAMDANPIGIIILAIAGLVAALLWLYNNNEWVRNSINWLWDSLKGLGEWIWNGIGPALKWLADVLLAPLTSIYNLITGNKSLADSWKWLTDTIQSGFSNFVAWLSGLPAQIMGFLGGIPAMLQGAFSGFMEWLAALPENLGRAVGDAIVLVLQGIYTILKFITDLPGQIAAAITNLGTQIVAAVGNVGPMISGAWNQITKIFTDFYNFMVNLPGNILKTLTDLGSQIVTGVMDIPNRAKRELDKIIYEFKYFLNWLKGLPGDIYKWVSKAFNDMVNFIMDIPNRAKRILDKIIYEFKNFINWLKGLPGQLYQAIIDAWNGFLRGLSEKFPQIKFWLDKIAGLFPHSPPKEGPLKDIMDWGANMSDAIQSGLDRSFPGLISNFADKMQTLKDIGTDLSADMGDLSAFSMSESTVHAVSNPTNLSQHTHQWDVNVKVDKLDVSSPEATEDSVEILFNKFMEKLKSEYNVELGQKGINPFRLR